MKQKKSLQNLRENYSKGGLTEDTLLTNPMEMFEAWINDAIKSQVPEPNAMIISTLSSDGFPTGRVVLLKDIIDGDFIFYTNYESAKAKEITHHEKVSITFLWKEIERQVRINGICHKVSEDISNAYFKKRPRGSQIGAWVSPQSKIITNRAFLEERKSQFEEQFKNQKDIPKPPNWGGFAVKPHVIEFWQGRPSRLHDRLRYTLENEHWKIRRLAP